MAITALCVPNWFQYKARTIIGYQNRLFLGNVCERFGVINQADWDVKRLYPDTMMEEWFLNRIRWTAERTVTDWTSIGSGYMDLPNQGDPILRFGRFMEVELYIFRGRSVWLAKPTVNPYTVIEYDGPITTDGILAPNSLQTIRMTPTSFDARYRLSEQASFIYLGLDDFYRLDAGGGEAIGKAIRGEFFKAIDTTQIGNAWSFQDAVARKYYLVTRLKDATQHAWIYDWEEKTWSRQDFHDYSTVFNCPPLTSFVPLVGGSRYALSLSDVGSPHYESIAGVIT